MNYKVESDFMFDGYRCVVLFQDTGHRCGYVGIPKGHILYGKGYSEDCISLKFKDVENSPVGKRGVIPMFMMSLEEKKEFISPNCYFDVHGGITYADGKADYPVESDLWWFGFDTAHSGDGKDLDSALQYELLGKEYYDRMNRTERMYPITGSVVRSLEYCEQECRNLAEQLFVII